MLSFILAVTVICSVANGSKLPEIPQDVLLGIASWLYYRDRRSFTILSTSCREAMQRVEKKSDEALDHLINRIALITDMEFQSDWDILRCISDEMRRVGHPRYFSKLPDLIKCIQNTKMNESQIGSLLDALKLFGNEDINTDIMTTNQPESRLISTGYLSPELRLLIIASRGIFDYFDDESELMMTYSRSLDKLRIPCLSVRADVDLHIHCSSSLPLRFALLYQCLIPDFLNLSSDEQFDLVHRYHFIPWSAQTVQAIKIKHSQAVCDLNDLNRVNVDAKRNVMEINGLRKPKHRIVELSKMDDFHLNNQRIERRRRRWIYGTLCFTLSIILIAVIIKQTFCVGD